MKINAIHEAFLDPAIIMYNCSGPSNRYAQHKRPMSSNFPEVASAEAMSTKQKLFLRYFTAILIDLLVLNLFAEHWHNVMVDSFTLSVS